MKVGNIFGVLKEAGKDWVADSAPRLGASVAFYTIFSLSPLLVIVLAIASFFLSDADSARTQLLGQISGLLGEDGAKMIEQMLTSPKNEDRTLFATVMAGVTLLIGSTGVFMELQAALNRVWEVKQDSGGGVWGFIKHRLLSFAMVLTIGFLLLVSLILAAGVAAFGKMAGGWMPGLAIVAQVLNFVVSFGVITLLFAFIFKFMPDVRMPWNVVWIGAAITSLLFAVGKFGLGMYLAKSSTASAFGAAGSLVIVLMWVYYSAQILFFGAEITQVYAKRKGVKIEPKEHASIDQDNTRKDSSPTKSETPQPAARPFRAGRAPRPGFVVPGLVLLLALFLPKGPGRSS